MTKMQTLEAGILRRLARLPFADRSKLLSWYRPWEISNGSPLAEGRGRTIIRESYRAHYPLPRNVQAGEELPGLAPPWVRSFSFKDVPQLKVDESFLMEFEDCWMVRKRYDWGGSEFCICTSDGRPLQFHGLNSDVDNFALRRAQLQAPSSPHQTLDQATWVVGYWYNNIYHWFVEWLPRLVLALDRGLPAENIVLPPLLGQWAWDSMKLLGIKPHWLDEKCDVWRIGRLTVVSESPHHAPAHRAVQQRLISDLNLVAGPKKRIWISRRDAVHRRLHQEAEIEAWLSARDWHIVQMEKLSFSEQVRTMAGAQAVAGMHGAGFTNLLFAPPQTPVLEIVVRERPCPEYYALASCLGHPYWFVPAQTEGRNPSLVHDDANVDIEDVKRAVIDLEQYLGKASA